LPIFFRLSYFCLEAKLVLPDPAPAKKSPFKNPMLYSSCVLAIIALYVGWIVFSRWYGNRSLIHREKQEQLERQREEDRAALEQLGGSELAIQMFYVSPATIRRGESAQLCYGVANAKTVTIEPAAGSVWPSYSRCLDISPSKTTTYKLTITGAAGTPKSQSVTITVR
jgi:hypothetical protein